MNIFHRKTILTYTNVKIFFLKQICVGSLKTRFEQFKTTHVRIQFERGCNNLEIYKSRFYLNLKMATAY